MGQQVGGQIEYGVDRLDAGRVVVLAAAVAGLVGGLAGYGATQVNTWGRPVADPAEVRLLRQGMTDLVVQTRELRRHAEDERTDRIREAIYGLKQHSHLAGRVRELESRLGLGLTPVPDAMPMREPHPGPAREVDPADRIPPQKLPVLPD